jgi:hypothetical protein
MLALEWRAVLSGSELAGRELFAGLRAAGSRERIESSASVVLQRSRSYSLGGYRSSTSPKLQPVVRALNMYPSLALLDLCRILCTPCSLRAYRPNRSCLELHRVVLVTFADRIPAIRNLSTRCPGAEY